MIEAFRAFQKKQEKTVGKDIVRLDRQALFTDDKYRRQAEQVRIEGDAKSQYLYLRAVSSGIKAFHDYNIKHNGYKFKTTKTYI